MTYWPPSLIHEANHCRLFLMVHGAHLLFSSQIPQNYDQGKAKAIGHLKALEDGIAKKLCLKKGV